MKGRIFKNALAAILLIAVVVLVQPGELLNAVSNLTPALIVQLIGISIVLIYVSALKWRLFIEHLSVRVSVLRLFGLYLVGYFVNLLLPSFVGGDAVRSMYIGKKVGHHQAFAATILERYTGIVAMFLLALTLMWFSPLATTPIRIAVVILNLGIVGATVFALSEFVLNTLHRVPVARTGVKHLRQVQAALKLAGRSPTLLFKAMVLSFVFHACAVINTLICAEAVGWTSAPVSELFVVLPMIFIVSSIPLTPASLGIQEGAFVYFMQGIGATPAQALGIALIIRAKTYLLALAGWVVWYFEPEYRKTIEEQNPPGETIH